jgi:hypothetical protein
VGVRIAPLGDVSAAALRRQLLEDVPVALVGRDGARRRAGGARKCGSGSASRAGARLVPWRGVLCAVPAMDWCYCCSVGGAPWGGRGAEKGRACDRGT